MTWVTYDESRTNDSEVREEEEDFINYGEKRCGDYEE